MTINTFPIRTVDATDLVEQIVTDLTSEPFAISDTAGLQNALDLKIDTADVQTNFIDADEDKILKVGAFGLGIGGGFVDPSVMQSLFLADIDDVSSFRSGEWVAQKANVPTDSDGTFPIGFSGTCIISIHLAAGIFWKQVLHEIEPPFRTSWRLLDNSGPITPWIAYYDQVNVIGIVSQSSGIPTGAIFERGSNANGEFVRFADGTQICTVTLDGYDLDTQAGDLFLSQNIAWSYPANFSSGTNVSVSASFNDLRVWLLVNSNGTTNAITRLMGMIAVTDRKADIMAVGRWF